MPEGSHSAPPWLIRREPLIVFALCVLALLSIPVALGHIGLSWDALNHHIYLGWTASAPRFDRDYLPASYQAYQYPYLYWPAYKLAVSGASGVLTGVVLAMLHSAAVPAVWNVAHTCMPGHDWFDLAMRCIAVALAFMSGVILSMFDTTGNDLLAAIPLVWAIALALEPLAGKPVETRRILRAVCLSGLLAGLSIAFKFSNAPIAIVLPLLWACGGRGAMDRIGRVVLGGVLTVLGFLIAYGYWGWQLWTYVGNPVYPFFDGSFEGLREWSRWAR